MADYNSALPVRSKQDADERLHAKIVDYTTPSQGLAVDVDGNLHAEMHGNNPAGSDETLRLSELGAPNPDGVYHATDNSDPANVGLVGHVVQASPADADQTIRITAIAAASGNRKALHTAILDENGLPFSASNPIPVTSVDSEGTEVNSYTTTSALAAAATADHDYTVTALMTLKLTQVETSSSARHKAEVKVETGVATGIFTTRFVKFGSTSNPNTSVHLDEAIAVAAGVRVRVSLTNLDNQASDVYSTISGHEIT